MAINRPILYVGAEMGMGNATDTLTETPFDDNPESVGGLTFYSFHAGMKYFTSHGLGGRIVFGYYQRSESYLFEEGSNLSDFTRTVAGPSVQLGLSFRW